MKKLIDKAIVFLSYKHPHLWLEINEMIFDKIKEYKKRQREKMNKNVQKLIKQLK